MDTKVALIVGVTGIVGNNLVDVLTRPDAATGTGPWKIYGLARRAKPDWFQNPNVNYIQCDLLNTSETVSKLSPLHDITHIFWVVWAMKDTEEEHCQANGLMLNSVLTTLSSVAKNLKHVCLQTGARHYLGPYFRFGTIQHYELPFHEDMARLTGHPNFYYTLEDILHEACRSTPSLTWSVHRPNIIFGIAPRNYANVLGSLAMYAAICKYEGMCFQFPGNQLAWESLTNVSDAELIAEQEVWAATNPSGWNQAFNVVNGDCVTWKSLWSVLAGELKLEFVPYSGTSMSLSEVMKGKDGVWREIVGKNDLVKTEIDAATWWAVDLCLNFPFQLMSCMNKSKEHGFLAYRNTRKSTKYWIDKMKLRRIIPNDHFWSSSSI